MKRMFTDCRLVGMHTDISQFDVYLVQKNTMIEVIDGVINAVGTDLAVDSHEIISLHNRLVTPGLIDCHTHLIFAGNRANEFEQRLNGISYQTIAEQGGGILATVHATRLASQDTLTELAIPRAQAMIRDGVTTIEIKSGYGLTLNHELNILRAAKALEKILPVNIVTTFLGAHALPPEYHARSDDYISYVCEEMIPAVAQEQLADCVDVFCERIGFSTAQITRVFDAALEHGLAIKGHTEQLSNLGGSCLHWLHDT